MEEKLDRFLSYFCTPTRGRVCDEKEIERKLHPLRPSGWLPVFISALLHKLTGQAGYVPLTVILMLWGPIIAWFSAEAWEGLRTNKLCAYIADRHPFLAFSLKNSPGLQLLSLVAIVVVAYQALFFGLFTLTPFFASVFGENMFRWVYWELVCMLGIYYGGILFWALQRRWRYGSNNYNDGTEYIRGETYKDAVAKREAAEREQAEQAAAEAEQARKDKEEAEQRHQEAVARYEAEKTEARARIWEWLNVGLKLDFPDEVCDAISDYNLGRQKNISRKRMQALLTDLVGEQDARRYTDKFHAVLLAVQNAAATDDLREGMEFKKNPLGANGEADVNYRLTWWVSKHPEYKMVTADCFSSYSASCIRIAAWDYIKEPQEIDHMLVGPAGVIHIETKDYIGQITVRNTQFWERDVWNNGRVTPFTSPAFQVERHDDVIRHIVGDGVPVHAIICLSNKNAAVNDAEKSEVPIVCLRDLGEYLDKLNDGEAAKLSPEDVHKALCRIEDAKVRNSKKRAEYEKKQMEKKSSSD